MTADFSTNVRVSHQGEADDRRRRLRLPTPPYLEGALAAIRDRGYWSAYPESPRAYGEGAEATGRAAFEAYVGSAFPHQAGTDGTVGAEKSPYGIELNVSYPHVTATTVDALIAAAQAGMPACGATRAPTSAPACAWRSSPASMRGRTRSRTR